MGCWNKTCLFTNLPIGAGEDVMCVVLAKQTWRDSWVYSTDQWIPFSAPFYAEYNDYGGFENPTGVWVDSVFERIKSGLLDTAKDIKKTKTTPVSKDGFNWETFNEGDHEGTLFIRDMMGEVQQLRVAQIKLSAVEYILKNAAIGSSKKSITFKTVLAAANKMITAERKAIAESKDLPIAERSFNAWRRMEDYQSSNLFMRSLRGDELRLGPMHSHLRLFDTIGKDVDLAKKLAEDLARMVFLNMVFSSARKTWCPTTGEGSQDQDTTQQKFLAQMTIELAKED